MNYVQIGSKKIGDGLPPLVIAEAGINHNGDINIAKEMVRAAKDIGADIIKFQTHIPDAEMLPDKGTDANSGSHVTGSLYDIMVECSLTKGETYESSIDVKYTNKLTGVKHTSKGSISALVE